MKDETRLVTGCSDSSLKVWHIAWSSQREEGEADDIEPGGKRKPRQMNTESNKVRTVRELVVTGRNWF